MSWQEHILHILDIRKAHPQLVLDKTGVLTHPQFLDYLTQQGLRFAVGRALPETLALIRERSGLVIAPFMQAPGYLAGKIDIQVLDYPQLPVEIDYAVAKGLHADQLIALLAYRHQSGAINLIAAANIEQELAKAHQLAKKTRVTGLRHDLETAVPAAQSYHDLLTLGERWGAYIHACFETRMAPDIALTEAIDQAAARIVLAGELKNAFYATAGQLQTVDKIRPYLEQKAKDTPKLALICFDGMGAAEWMLLKTHLAAYGFRFAERYLFALIPTITKISRSAIFYGDCVGVYALKTAEEIKAFAKHFPNRACRLFREGDIGDADHLLGIDLVVVIYNFLDDIAHDTKLPPGDLTKWVYFKNLLTYLQRSRVQDELRLLQQLGYAVFICSDHGCVVGRGSGRRIDKYLIEESSKRATLVAKTDLAQFYDVHHYPIPFLASDKIALLAKQRTLFAPKNYVGLSHGGITLEELVVPFAEVLA